MNKVLEHRTVRGRTVQAAEFSTLPTHGALAALAILTRIQKDTLLFCLFEAM